MRVFIEQLFGELDGQSLPEELLGCREPMANLISMRFVLMVDSASILEDQSEIVMKLLVLLAVLVHLVSCIFDLVLIDDLLGVNELVGQPIVERVIDVRRRLIAIQEHLQCREVHVVVVVAVLLDVFGEQPQVLGIMIDQMRVFEMIFIEKCRQVIEAFVARRGLLLERLKAMLDRVESRAIIDVEQLLEMYARVEIGVERMTTRT